MTNWRYWLLFGVALAFASVRLWKWKRLRKAFRGI